MLPLIFIFGVYMLKDTDIEKFEKLIGYTFRDKALITQAFTHSSFVNEQKIGKKPDYERLEFLGDAILEMISSAYLFRTFPDKKEGEMSKMRASLVCEGALAYDSNALNIREYIQLGKGEEATGGRNKESVIADVMDIDEIWTKIHLRWLYKRINAAFFNSVNKTDDTDRTRAVFISISSIKINRKVFHKLKTSCLSAKRHRQY